MLPALAYNVFYHRIIGMYLAYFHYKRQTHRVKAMPAPLPFLTNAIQLLPLFDNNPDLMMPIIRMTEETHGKDFNKSTVVFASYEPLLVIGDVEVMEALYTT